MKKTLNDLLCEIGDYALVAISVDGASKEAAAVVRVNRDYYQLCSNNSCLDGSNYLRSTSIHESELDCFENGWVYDGRRNDLTAAQVLTAIISEDGKSITFDGSTIAMPKPVSFRSKKYTDTVDFTGMHGYHDHHGCEFNTPRHNKRPYRIGVELEVEFNNSVLRRDFTKTHSNWFFLERDGSLGDYGCEIITVPLAPMDAKDVNFWSELTEYLSGKSRSWDTSTCGLHVHIGREILGDTPSKKSETIGKLLYLYHHFLEDSQWNRKIFGRAEAYSARDGKTDYGRAIKTLGTSIIRHKDLQKNLCREMTEKNESDRYYDINLTNEATIEFRKGRGSLKATRIAAVVEYVELMTLYAKMSAWTSISEEGFIKYLLRRVKKNSPLYSFIESGE